ncbi:zinc finger BED domain-containing protein RICESLEEPER 1-like [Pistacia vera]|uniref:zinc finger BED domain-containing protein RICESLEEPER 1-like n=1 Tax=Pistacia vera TaxID=55513 RepID=UPI0012638A1C|nr:zinc finger BED domain-containing protein RICESLEEPER 1-like [Pistacia vera]
MEARTMEFDPQLYLYFQVGKETISEGMKRLQNLAHWYNSIPEKVGLFDEIITYLQSLQRQIKEIESLAQRGKAHVSSNINTTDLRHGQEITQIREQNKEIEMVMNTNVENSSCSKRKRRSKVWEDFTYSVGKDGKEWAQCKHCKKEFVGSSKSGTTHLKNHLKSCPVLRNPGGVADKAKEKTVIDPESNGSDLVRKIIKYGIKGIKDDIVDVYQQEKDKIHEYLDKLTCRFNVTIDPLPTRELGMDSWSMKIWVIDDSWELKNRIICLGESIYDIKKRVKSFSEDWKRDKKICSMIKFGSFYVSGCEEVKDIGNWFTGTSQSVLTLLIKIDLAISFDGLAKISRNDILTNMRKLRDYIITNAKELQSGIEKASTSESLSSSWVEDKDVVEWVMGCKEALCELEDIDPDFKSINFIKEDWDEATLMYNCQKALNDLGEDVDNFLDHLEHKTANEYFPMICQIFSKLDQLERSDNSYICDSVSHLRKNIDKLWNGSMLVLVTRVILDPRFKNDFIIKKLYEEMYKRGFTDVGARLIGIIDGVTNIFNQYVKETNNPMSSSS